MEMNIHKGSIDDFYKEMFKGSDKNQRLKSLELAFNALLDNKMFLLNKELAKLGSHNVFNQNGTITMDKINNGGFVFQISNIKIMDKAYDTIYLSGNNILELMDNLIENIVYLEAFVNIAEQSTKNLKPTEKKKFTDKLITEAYDEFPNPSVNLKEVENGAKAEVTVKTTIENIVEKLPPKLKDEVRNDLSKETVVSEVLDKVAENPTIIENFAKQKVSEKAAEVIEEKVENIVKELDPKGKKELLNEVQKAVQDNPITQDINIELKSDKQPEEISDKPKTIDQVANRLSNPEPKFTKNEDGVLERPLNEEEKEKLDKALGKDNKLSFLKVDQTILDKGLDFKELNPVEFENLDDKAKEEYLKKKQEFDNNFVGPRMP